MTISANVTAASITPSASSWRPDAALAGAGMTASVASTALPTVPGAPVIISAVFDGVLGTTVLYEAPASDGGSAVSSYVWYRNESAFTPHLQSAGQFYAAVNMAGDQVRVAAVNAIGEGPKSAPVTVTGP